MTEQPGVQVARATFEMFRAGGVEIARGLVDDPEAAVEDAARRFEEMIPGLAYLDAPDHPMADSLYQCSTALALYLALADRGIDVHDFGAAFHKAMTAFVGQLTEDPFEYDEAVIAAAAESQRNAREGEFIFEAMPANAKGAWGINILSCGICHQFAKYDAMGLVPYMCAGDDILSERFDEGLRRTGTIALGAHHCDFRFQPGGEPLGVAEQHPQEIRIRSEQ